MYEVYCSDIVEYIIVQCTLSNFWLSSTPSLLSPLVYYTILQYYDTFIGNGLSTSNSNLYTRRQNYYHRGFIEAVYVNPFKLYLNNILNASDIVVSCVNYSCRLLSCSIIIIILYRVIHFSLKHSIFQKLWTFLKIFILHNFKRLENKIIYFTILYRCLLWRFLNFLMTTCVFNSLF